MGRGTHFNIFQEQWEQNVIELHQEAAVQSLLVAWDPSNKMAIQIIV
jgi:hypothetical protein